MRLRGFIILVCLLVVFVTGCKASAEEKFLDIQEVKSKSGITAWLVEDHTLPLIAMEFAFRGAGAAGDAPEKQGLSQLASNTFDEGAGDIKSQEFQQTLTDNSIALSFSSDRDDFRGTLRTLTRKKDIAFKLLHLSLTAPRFDAEAVERMRAANLARLRLSLTDPDWMAARVLNSIAFAGHPYAQNSGGTLTTLAALTPDDLKQFAKTRLGRDNVVISVTGDITPKELTVLLDDVFGALPPKAAVQEVPDLAVQGGGETALFSHDIPQSIIQIMQPGIGRDHPDYYPYQIMNFIYGGSGFGSRLMTEVRENRGLTYGIFSSLYLLDHLKALSVSTSTENANAAQVLTLTREAMSAMMKEPVTDKELNDAKSYLTGSMPLSLTSTGAIARLVLGLRLDRLPIDYLDTVDDKINAVTKEDVLHAAQTYLQPDKLTTVIVGKPEGITPTRTMDKLPDVD
jgi:zinc protease